jgi:hypothetical protein
MNHPTRFAAGVLTLLAIGNRTAAMRDGQQVTESEPNNAPASATLISPGDTISGVTVSDIDHFALDLTAGTDVLIHFDIGDHTVVLLDRNGETVLVGWSYWDGNQTRSIRCRIFETGRYFVRLTPYGDGSGSWWGHDYHFRVSTSQQPPDSVTLEIEPNYHAGNATPADLGDVLVGVIDSASDVDQFQIALDSGMNVEFDLDAHEGGLDSPLNAELSVGPFGVGRPAIGNNVNGADPVLWLAFPATRRYRVSVKGRVNWADSGRGAYRIRVRRTAEAPPTVQALFKHFLEGDVVAASHQEFLDRQGNRNGALDLGDFHAYLQSLGILEGLGPLPALLK